MDEPGLVGRAAHDDPPDSCYTRYTYYTRYAVAVMSGDRWWHYAACKGLPLEAFFPPGRYDDKERRAAVLFVQRICVHCPVRMECAEDALANGDRYGVRAAVDLGDGLTYGKKWAAKQARLHRAAGHRDAA
ncbi:WhiB family transcriptional regulator [Nocardia sp. CA-145437]|uniref:WhiB family transcriptional regulator n=1 Tax=Nocardia sp. CA-145437 TaxID=3239980 RepID=UPI003D98C497